MNAPFIQPQEGAKSASVDFKSMATPCSVKAMGLYLNPILSLLEVPNWHLQ